ncbi:MAG TPA: SCO6880 family protein [Acidimicrobiales bacterium]|nr:SCO6880 family protein [Acidimicrobiales bacterium]
MSDASPTVRVSARFARRPSRGVLLGFSGPRLAALGSAAAVAVAGLVAANLAGLLVAGLVWAPLVAGAFVRVAGRPPVEWAATAAHYEARRLAGQTRYRSRLPSAPRLAGTLGLPGDAAALRVHVDPVSGAAMIHDPHRHTLSAAVSVSHPAFALLDRDDQAGRVSRWGRLQAGLVGSMSVSALQVMESVVPDPGDGLVEWYRARGARRGGWADSEYETLLDAARLGSSTHRTTISIALDMRGAARAIRAGGGGLAGAAGLLRQDMAALVDQLRQVGLSVGKWLSEAELASIIRHAYDPDVVLDARADPGANLSRAGPMAVAEGWDHLRHDSGFSAVLWVSEWPRVEVPPDFLHPIVFCPGVRRSLSIITRPIPADAALRQIRKEKASSLADQAQKARIGQVADLSDAQEYSDLLARERSVISGHTDVEFCGLITVTAPTQAELEAARAAIVRAAGAAACEVRPLYGRQAQGFVCGALPLARSPF